MSLLAQLVIALALFGSGVAGGIKWHVGIVAARDLAAHQARETDAKQQRQFNDQAGGKHAAALATVNTQLGAAREKIARLSGRDCLDPDTVRMLNTIGAEPVRAAAGDAESAPQAATPGTGLRFTTDRDIAGAVAACRAEYGAVSSQLHQILDIEDRRHPPPKLP